MAIEHHIYSLMNLLQIVLVTRKDRFNIVLPLLNFYGRNFVWLNSWREGHWSIFSIDVFTSSADINRWSRSRRRFKIDLFFAWIIDRCYWSIFVSIFLLLVVIGLDGDGERDDSLEDFSSSLWFHSLVFFSFCT